MRGGTPSRTRPGLTASERAGWERTYAETSYRKLPWFSPRPSPWLVEAVRRRWLAPRIRILDIGCGAGTNVLWLAAHGFDATGVDVAPAAIAAATARAGRVHARVRFCTADATRLPFANGEFSAAIDSGCFHTLPLRLRRSYAAEVSRVLLPGSSYLLTWVHREETRTFGPSHRPSLAEVTTNFEDRFVFASTQLNSSDSQAAWITPRTGLATATALLVRRRKPQPPPR